MYIVCQRPRGNPCPWVHDAWLHIADTYEPKKVQTKCKNGLNKRSLVAKTGIVVRTLSEKRCFRTPLRKKLTHCAYCE